MTFIIPDQADDALKKMKTEKFDTLGALLHMEKADIDDLALGPKGIVRAVQGAVSELQTVHGHGRGPMAVATTQPQHQAAGASRQQRAIPLDAVLQAATKSGAGGEQPVSEPGRVDTVYLQQEKSDEQSKHLKIVDFVLGAAKVHEEIDIGGATLKLKSAPSRWNLNEHPPPNG